MLPKLELARGQASLAIWVVSKPAQCTSAAYTKEEVAAQQEQHKQLYRCKTQRQQDQRGRGLSQVQQKPGVVVQSRASKAACLALSHHRNAKYTMAPLTPDFGVSCTNSGHLTRWANSGNFPELARSQHWPRINVV
jgi:hypothetical protein